MSDKVRKHEGARTMRTLRILLPPGTRLLVAHQEGGLVTDIRLDDDIYHADVHNYVNPPGAWHPEHKGQDVDIPEEPAP